jgi:hypothetical protein
MKGGIFSLDLVYEAQSWFVALGLTDSLANRAHDALLGGQPTVTMKSLRAGVILSSGSTAPYLAAGAAHMSQHGPGNFEDCSGGSCDPVDGSGPAVIAEAGILFFRHLRFGRVAASAQLVVPLFQVKGQISISPHVDAATLLLVGLRVFG